MKKKTERENVYKILKKLAFGKSNDAVRLVFEDEEEVRRILKKLDLTMLAGIKKGANGTVEIRLVDRMAAAEKLLDALGEKAESGGGQVNALLEAIKETADKDESGGIDD